MTRFWLLISVIEWDILLTRVAFRDPYLWPRWSILSQPLHTSPLPCVWLTIWAPKNPGKKFQSIPRECARKNLTWEWECSQGSYQWKPRHYLLSHFSSSLPFYHLTPLSEMTSHKALRTGPCTEQWCGSIAYLKILVILFFSIKANFAYVSELHPLTAIILV